MPALTRRDAERLLRLVADADGAAGDQPFTREFLVALGDLVEADAISYCELDRVRKRDLYYVERADDEEGDPEVGHELVWQFILEEDPLCMAQQRGDFSVHKLSDFLTLRELHSTRLYELWLGPSGAEHEIDLAIPSPLWHTKTLMFTRGPGPDFTERDRLVLAVLQPHLTRLWHDGRRRRLLTRALAELDRADEQDPRGVILLGPAASEVEFASPPAQRLLQTFFPGGSRGVLPAGIEEWLASGSPTPLVRRRGPSTLSVTRKNGALLLEERRDEARLTPREREVLAWVARGKTNSEIALLLWVSPGTIRKHLENVYAKLGVNTRTAAAASFLGMLDAEAS